MNDTKPTSSTIDDFRRRHGLPHSTFYDLVKAGRIRLTYISARNPRITDDDERAFLESCRKSDTAERGAA